MTNNDTNDLFGMQMLYEKVDANLSNNAYYNGKLSAVKWMSKDGSGNSSYERAFKYSYDALNRDTAAIYAERTTASTGSFTTTHGWDENRITYDENGNIKTMYRNASTQGSGTHAAIDNLSFTYSSTNPNQLQSVADASGSSQGFMVGTGNYTYDSNGNLTNEPYKGLSAISYNVLNRTDNISFSSSANRYLSYTYGADGTMIRKQQYDNVGGVLTLMTTTDYIDGFVYTTAGAGAATLAYFAMPEGRVLNNSGTLSQEFDITDQQGNVRIAFDNTGTGGAAKVRQENSYYAYGMIMPGSAVATPGNPNKNLYNGGSEWQNDYSNLPDYQQTFFCNYDAALGRWVGADPQAESAESMTSYQYAGNNPIMFNDPLGNKRDANDWGGGLSSNRFYNEAESSILHTADGTIAGGGGGGDDNPDFSSYWSGVFANRGLTFNFGPSAYSVNKEGGIQFLGNIDGTTDMLFGNDKNGNVDYNNTTVVDQGILGHESISHNYIGKADVGYYDINYTANTRTLFEFLAKNTDIEWALIRYNSGSADKAILARDIQSNTASSESVSFEFAVNYVLDGHSEPNNWQIIDAGHSHPAGNEYHGPSGYDPRDIHTIRQDGDIQLAHIYQTLPAFPNMNFNFYIYDADSTNGGYYKYSSPANQPPQVSGPYSSYLNLPH